MTKNNDNTANTENTEQRIDIETRIFQFLDAHRSLAVLAVALYALLLIAYVTIIGMDMFVDGFNQHCFYQDLTGGEPLDFC